MTPAEEITKLAALYNVPVNFDPNLIPAGEASRDGYITMKPSNDRVTMLQTFFHELGHIHCYRNKLWVNYHYNIRHKTGIKAERWVDKWAAKEMAKHYPGLPYDFLYNDPETVKWFKNYIWNTNSTSDKK